MNYLQAVILERFITNFAGQHNMTVLEAIVLIRDHLNKTLEQGSKK